MPVYRFVDAIDASPTVLLDLDDQDPLTVLEGVDTSPPRRRVSSFGSAARDGDVVSQDSYSDRMLRVPLAFKVGTSAEVQSETVQQLGRLLDGPQWLMWQHDGKSAPVFFRTKYGDITVDDEIGEDPPQRVVTLSITAEPFAYGLPVSDTVTVNNDPTHATNPMSFVMPDVLGDVASPLRLKFQPTNETKDVVVAVTAADDAPVVPFYFDFNDYAKPANALGVVTDVADAAMIGGDARRVVMSGGSFGDTQPVVYPLPVTIPAGDYRVLLRYKASAPAMLGLDVGLPGGVARTLEFSHTAADSGLGWRDLGVVRVSLAGARDVAVGDWIPAGTTQNLFLLWRSSTTSAVDLDGLLFVPAGLDSAELTTFGVVHDYIESAYGTSRWMFVDSLNSLIAVTNTAQTQGITDAVQTLAGAFPAVLPGVTNVVSFLASVGTVAALSDSKSTSTAVEWSYFPRYLYDRPAAS